MLRTYAKPGDIVECPLISHKVVIKTIFSQDYYGPEEGWGWQIEFIDTNDEYRAWKQRCDKGRLAMLGTNANPYVDYLTRKELLGKIANAIEKNDEFYIQYWNDVLDELDTISQGTINTDTWVVVQCAVCESHKPVLLEDILGEEYWNCIDCDLEVNDWLTESYPCDLTETDPNINYNTWAASHDRDEDEEGDEREDGDISDEEYYDTTAQDLRDAASNMPCDNTGVCCGDSCSIYSTCQVQNPDK